MIAVPASALPSSSRCLSAAAGEEATVGATGAELDAPVAVLHRAATDPSVPPMEVFKVGPSPARFHRAPGARLQATHDGTTHQAATPARNKDIRSLERHQLLFSYLSRLSYFQNGAAKD